MKIGNSIWKENNPHLHNPHLDGDAFYWEAGPVGVFLSHGFSATTIEIRPLAEKLNELGYTVAAPLLPGHGTHPKDLNRTHWQDWLTTGKETLEKLFQTCDHVFVGGESMGGLLSLYLASLYPQVSGILLYAPAIRTQMKPLDYLKLYLLAPFVPQIGRDGLDCDNVWQGYSGLPLKGLVQFLRFQAVTRKRLSEVTQPVLIFQGRQDMTVAPEAGKMIMEGISSDIKEHHWMEKSSHVIVLDVEFEQVASLSIQFIEKNL